jgi:hypothetical protein
VLPAKLSHQRVDAISGLEQNASFYRDAKPEGSPPMNRTIPAAIAAVVLLLFSTQTFAARANAGPFGEQQAGAPLEDVVYIVHKALEQAEAVHPPCPRAEGAKCFPPLTSIKLELNTTVGKSAGVSINFLVFTIGHTRSRESSSTLTIEFSLPAAKFRTSSLEESAEALAKAIVNAKKSYAAAAEIDPELTKGKVTLVFKFVVSSETKGGLKITEVIPIGLEGNAKLTLQQIHTITLIFSAK